MPSASYVARKLVVGDKTYSEQQLLESGTAFIVLAEPGAGKTELLSELASLLGVTPIRASIFRNRKAQPAPALVIDAMDEIARIDKLAMDAIIVQACYAESGKVIFAGRSSEWDGSRTRLVQECFGTEPVVVRLEPFNESEQHRLFETQFPGEDFRLFVEEARRMELGGLLGNPQFLQLFGEAFVENDHRFTSKPAIFSDAARRLAHETNTQVQTVSRPPLDRIVAIGGEVFAKLMLCGASGVSTVERLVDRDYPYLAALASKEGRFLLDTRLLKPSADPEKHEPVHRIVAEYCAARYLASRIEDSTDRLSLPRLLSVIAPSGAVRTELRGMVGWMAALSSEPNQLKLVELDPYAVLANGDASALTAGAKRRLLARLNQVARDDPYFRRGDVWRQFNVGQFFTPDIRADVAAILAPDYDNTSLRDLVTELISSSQASLQFAAELRTLALDSRLYRAARKACFAQLVQAAPDDALADIKALQAEGSTASLELAARATQTLGAERVGRDQCVGLLRQLAGLYPKRESARDPDVGSRHFIKRLIQEFDLTTVRFALDRMTDGLACTCNPRHTYRCECRIGISKIAGALLDRYFQTCLGPHDPTRIWGWTKALHFRHHSSEDSSSSVKFLSESDGLRRAVQWLAISGDWSEAETQNAVSHLFMGTTHSGIRFHAGDMGEVALRAYEAGDNAAWTAMWTRHNIHDPASRANPIRTLQRGHARQNPELMRIWARCERQVRDMNERRDLGIRWRRGRRGRREAEIEAQNREHFMANRQAIAEGRFGGWTSYFARLFLLEPQKLAEFRYYGETPTEALRNCVPYLRDHLPSLRDLSSRTGSHIAQILLAHCIVRFREGAALEELAPNVLQAVFTETGSWPAFGGDEEEERRFTEILTRAVFTDASVAEHFVTEFIEPALASSEEAPTHVDWLESKEVFKAFLPATPLEWLSQYPRMPQYAMESLFNMAVQHGDRHALAELIDERLTDPVLNPGENAEENKRAVCRHNFWVLNAFFFNTPQMETAWDELRRDRNSLLVIEDRIGRFGGRENALIPPPSAEAIYRILDAFVDVWPQVPLPSSFGTGSPPEERAYRFLNDIVWRIAKDAPDRKLPVIDRLLANGRFSNFRDVLLTLRAETLREIALQDFTAPAPADISGLLDRNQVASVEDLRALLVEELGELQKWLKQSETNPLDTFYDGGRHVDENTGRNRVVDRLNARMTALGLSVVIEHHMAGGNRCDFTATAAATGKRLLVVVEVKGQWHPELFTAASAQLSDRYASHPDAAGQGIYLVFWFGGEETIAGKVDTTNSSPDSLGDAIIARMPAQLKSVIDVVVLDVSRPAAGASPAKRPRAGRRKASSEARSARSSRKGTMRNSEGSDAGR